MPLSSNAFQNRPAAMTPIPLYPLRMAPENDPENRSDKPTPFGRSMGAHEELPYKVELWDEAKRSVEQVLAVTANGSIGYAAYYAATREHPDRFVTLRHKNSIISRWNAPEG